MMELKEYFLLLLICSCSFFYDEYVLLMYQKSNKPITLKTKQMLNIDLRIEPCRHSCLIFIIPKLFSYDTRELKRVIKLTDFFHRLLICVYMCTHAQTSFIFVLYSNPHLSLNLGQFVSFLGLSQPL